MRKDAAELLSQEEVELAESVLVLGRQEIENVERQLTALMKIPASPSFYVPVGF